jgi:hypothetical protein
MMVKSFSGMMGWDKCYLPVFQWNLPILHIND